MHRERSGRGLESTTHTHTHTHTHTITHTNTLSHTHTHTHTHTHICTAEVKNFGTYTIPPPHLNWSSDPDIFLISYWIFSKFGVFQMLGKNSKTFEMRILLYN